MCWERREVQGDKPAEAASLKALGRSGSLDSAVFGGSVELLEQEFRGPVPRGCLAASGYLFLTA